MKKSRAPALIALLAVFLLAGGLLSGCTTVPEVHTRAPTKQDMQRLGNLAATGRLDAIDELARTADRIYDKDHSSNTNRPTVDNLTLMRAAFDPIGTRVGQGSSAAMAALKYAHGNRRLSSFTPDAFGIAAGMGNRESLDILLNCKQHQILLSSAVFALQSAADRNIPEAVDFLADVVDNPRHQALWHGVAKGLAGAAARGNPRAADAVRKFSEWEDSRLPPEVREEQKRRDEADAHAKQLQADIRQELAAIKRHPWAGEYYCGDGLGANIYFQVAPQAGFLFEWHGCLGLYDRNYGPVAFSNGTLVLSFTLENVQKGFQGIDPAFVPVAWGKRTYLIPADDLVGFCNDVNAGYEPREDVHGHYLLRRGDENKKVSGFPSVPAGYRPCLLKQPLETEVIAVGSSTTRPSCCKWNFLDTEVTINKGAADGVFTGMMWHVYSPRFLDDIRITRVEDHTAVGIVRQIGTDDPPPEIGWQASTVVPWKRKESPLCPSNP